MKTLPKVHLHLWLQWFVTAELSLIKFNVGLVLSWSSPYVAKLSAIKNPDSELPLSDVDASWVASLPSLSRPVGAILGGVLVYIIGTKLSMLLSTAALTLGWLCFFVIGSLPLVYVSRIVSGVGLGMIFSVSPLYIGEIAHPKIRGALVALTMQGLLVGNLCGSIMGKYLSMSMYAGISVIPCVIFFILFSVMPETPHYLVRHNKIDEAAKSILFYDKNAHVKNQLNILTTFLQTNKSLTIREVLRELNTPVNRRALLVVNIVSILEQLSGMHALTAYTENILEDAHVDIIEPSSLVIIVTFISIVSSFLGMLTYDKYGRVKMLYSSCIVAAFALFLTGLNYLLLDLGYDDSNWQWLSIIAMTLIKITYALGLGMVPSALASEMFAPSIKGVGSCIRISVTGIFAFLATKFFQPLINIITEKYLFFIYSFLMLVTALYTNICVPETKGKSLPEIQEMLKRRIKNKKDNNDNSND